MDERRMGLRLEWAWLVTGLVAPACSLAFDLSARQCETTADCRKLGSAFAETECQSHLCVSTAPSAGSGGSSGAGEGGWPAGSDATAGGGGERGGAAGADSGCTSHEECVDSHWGQLYACMHGSCVELETSECPVVLGAGTGQKNLKQNPIIIGAFARLEGANNTAKSRYNFELAIDEFNSSSSGLPAGIGEAPRHFMAVVCRFSDSEGDYTEPIDAALTHLIDRLEVPAILAALPEAELLYAFSEAATRSGEPVFFLSPFNSNPALANLDDGSMLWHMMDDTRELVPPLVSLAARAEEFQDESRTDAGALKAALVESDTVAEREIAEALHGDLRFNGEPASASANADHYTRMRIGSELTDPDNLNLDAALLRLKEQPPHVILAITTGEFFGEVVPELEVEWNDNPAVAPGQPRPFYVLSQGLVNETEVAEQIEAFPDLADRVAGAAFSIWEDRTLYNEYLTRFELAFPENHYENTENYYDAAYYLMYAFAAAGGSAHYTGTDVLRGIKKLVRDDLEIDSYEACQDEDDCIAVGPGDVANTIAHFRQANASSVALVGTGGPPSFDPTYGTRRTDMAAFCYDTVALAPTIRLDAQAWNRETGSFEGTFPCFEGF